MSSNHTSFGQRSVEGFLWTGSAVAAQAIGQIMVLALLARLLTPTEFGVVSAALVVVGLVRIFTDGSIGPAVTQSKNLTPIHQATAFALALYIGLAACLTMFVGANVVSGIFDIPQLVPIIHVLAFVALLDAPGAVPAGLLQRDLNFPRLSTIEMVSFIGGYALVGVVSALFGAGVWALVAAELSYSGIRSLLLMIARPHPKSILVRKVETREIMGFSGGNVSGRFLNYMAGQLDFVVVGRWMSAEALGFYGRAFQLAMRPSVLLGEAMDRVIFPVMASVQDDIDYLRRVYRRSLSLAISLAAPAAALGVLLGPELIRLVLGPGWDAAIVPFQVFAFGLIFKTGHKPADSLTKATGHVYQRAWRQGVYAVLIFGFALVGTRWGLPGVAVGVVLAVFSNYLMMAQLSRRIAQVPWSEFFADHLRGLILAGLVVATVLPTSTFIRQAGGSGIATIAGSLAVVGLVAYAAWKVNPRGFLGPEVLWFAAKLKDFRSKLRASRGRDPEKTPA